MFVKNLTKEELLYNKNGAVLKIKPGINLVDELKWDIEELKRTYGPLTLVAFDGEAVEAEEPAKEEAEETNSEIGEEAEETNAEIGEEKGEDAGEADQAVEAPTPEAPAEEKIEEGEAVKTETEEKAPAKATAKQKSGKKSNK